MLLKKIFIFSLFVLLNACGFHPKGSFQSSTLQHVYLEGGSHALRENFKNLLTSQTSQPEQAKIIIKLLNEDSQRRMVSLSARGKANEYEVLYRLSYEICDAQNNLLTDRQFLEIRREYFNDQQAIMAKDYEENIIRDEMQKQLAQTVLDKARFVMEQKNAP